MLRRILPGLTLLCLSIPGCASHKDKTAENSCQNTIPDKHGNHQFVAGLGRNMQNALPVALGAIPGAGNFAGGLAGMGMRQAMNGFKPHNHQPTSDTNEQPEQPEKTAPSFPCQPEKETVPDLKADDIKMEEAR